MEISKDANRRFCELAGIDPTYSNDGCPLCGTRCTNQTDFCTPPIPIDPDFSSPIEVLRVMKARKDWAEFVDYLKMFGQAIIVPASMPTCIDFHYLYIDLLLTPGALRDKAIEWMEGKE